MNRRTLLVRFAAIVGAVALAPTLKGEAAPVPSEVMLTLMPGQRWVSEDTIPKTHDHFEGDGCLPDLGMLRVTPTDDPVVDAESWLHGYDAGVEATHGQIHASHDRLLATWPEVYAPSETLTFEAMQADCEARGCRFEQRAGYADAVVVYSHGPLYSYHAVDTFDPVHLRYVEAWRQNLHHREGA